ncbi:hypothetical protein NAS141_04123 [Sulfitobacter sp. NAS-14.1]|nr:hypothetical protein NAS141_04123 [Sulfitobacter sp. NAS-14.1]
MKFFIVWFMKISCIKTNLSNENVFSRTAQIFIILEGFIKIYVLPVWYVVEIFTIFRPSVEAQHPQMVGRIGCGGNVELERMKGRNDQRLNPPGLTRDL